MVALNGMSRYHLAIEALRRTSRAGSRGDDLVAQCRAILERQHAYTREHFIDMPEISDWVWSDPSR
jgi:xylulose-5-phosphate/fructose-6-phosphate phosphoketolase